MQLQRDPKFLTMADFAKLVEEMPDAWAIASRAYEVTIPQMREMIEARNLLCSKFLLIFVQQIMAEEESRRWNV
jgi:hypothetical protein